MKFRYKIVSVLRTNEHTFQGYGDAIAEAMNAAVEAGGICQGAFMPSERAFRAMFIFSIAEPGDENEKQHLELPPAIPTESPNAETAQ